MKNIRAITLVATLLLSGSAMAMDGEGLSQADQRFVTDFAKSNLAQVHLGILAASKGSTPDIRAYGRWMISTHSFASRELSTIVERFHDEKPQFKNDPQADEEMGKLENLDGKAFDKSYFKTVIQDHESAISQVETEAKSGQDKLVKSFAANFLPVVKEHLAEVRLMTAEMKNEGGRGAEADANMKAANGGMSATVHRETGDAAAIRKQHDQ